MAVNIRPQSAANSVQARRPNSGSSGNPKSRLPTAGDVSALLEPRPESATIRRVQLHVRRPNTAGLRDHLRPWDHDKLQSVITRNGIGCATWRHTMRELVEFSRHRRVAALAATSSSAAAAAAEDDDDSDIDVSAISVPRSASASLANQRASPNAAAAGDDGTGVPPSRMVVGGKHAIATIPSDAVLLKTLHGIVALEAAMCSAARAKGANPDDMARNATSAPPRRRIEWLQQVADDLRAVVLSDELQRNDTRAPGVTVKVVQRSAVLEAWRLQHSGPSNRNYVDHLVSCFNAFSGGESVVMVAPLVAVMDHLLKPSAPTILLIILTLLKSLKATAHRAELFVAERLVADAAEEAERAALRDQQPPSSPSQGALHTAASFAASSRRRSFVLPPSPKRMMRELSSTQGSAAVVEFKTLIRDLLAPIERPAQGGGGGGNGEGQPPAPSFTSVDAVTWKDMRTSILTSVDSKTKPRYPQLLYLVQQNNL